MIILTQHNEKSLPFIVNFQQVDMIYCDPDGNQVKASFAGTDSLMVLGEYATHDRAQKVVLDIVDKYEQFVRGFGRYDPRAKEADMPVMFDPPKVYKMPSDEEAPAG